MKLLGCCLIASVGLIALQTAVGFTLPKAPGLALSRRLHLQPINALTSSNPLEGLHSAPSIDVAATRCDTALSATIGATMSPEPKRPTAIKTIARKTVKKLVPLGLMLFFILFNYTILRDTKDVLVVTAPNSGAEIIPFLKTYVNLPSAIGFTLIYSALCNKMSPDKVFYVIMTAFLTFFGAFAGFICKCLICVHLSTVIEHYSFLSVL